jgi:hypothetical protein
MGLKLLRVVALGACGLLLSCDRPAEWSALVYRDRADLDHPEFVGNYGTFEECQAQAINRLRQYEEPDAGDFICGFKCRTREDFGGLMICKDKRK